MGGGKIAFAFSDELKWGIAGNFMFNFSFFKGMKEGLEMIDLTAKPFNLNTEEIEWVESTLGTMDLKAKVGQLFCPIGMSYEEPYLQNILDTMQPGGILFRPGKGIEIQYTHRYLQQNSKIPLLIAANLEVGGNGSPEDGTFYGYPMQVAATDNEEMAYRLGVVSAREGVAVGCNWAFAPIIDIAMNFRNPITNVRTYGSDPERVLRMSKAYMKGVQDRDAIVSIKHFPGDGVDDRDQHLHMTVNSLSTQEWDDTFGQVYKSMIDEGANSVMVGQIMLPAYSRLLRPDIKDEEIMPATLSPELLQTLLREKLGFNGVIITDASPMGGFTMAERREIAIPKTIAAGCDMFLFNRNITEDFSFMMSGIEKGILTVERVDEAVTRILALKASMGLHRKQQAGTLVPGAEALTVLKCQEHEAWARECADRSVTLVKDTQQVLPLNVQAHKRIWLYVLGDEDGHFGNGAHEYFKEKLECEGFEVEIFDKDKLRFSYMGLSIEDTKAQYDAVIYLANIETASNKTVLRVNWNMPMASDMPWFIKDIPTIGVSLSSPYLLQDIPQLKTLINAYSGNEYVMDAVVDKLLGRSPFKGISPIDPYCGYWEAKL